MIAFVLSGGGNRGAVQAGAMLSLLEHKIRPDLIVGTSVGALNGIALACNPTVKGASWIVDVWRQLKSHDVFPGNSLTVGWRVLRGGGSFHTQASFERMVRSKFSQAAEHFGDLRVPTLATATELDTGELRLFGSDPKDPVVDAILASTAIPPFFPPYRYKDEWLVDGSVVANLPLSIAVNRGARTIYALNIEDAASPASGVNLTQTMSYSLSAMLNRQNEQERSLITHLRLHGVTVHLLSLKVDRATAYNDFRHGAALVDSGYNYTNEYLAKQQNQIFKQLVPAWPPQPRWTAMLDSLRQRFWPVQG